LLQCEYGCVKVLYNMTFSYIPSLITNRSKAASKTYTQIHTIFPFPDEYTGTDIKKHI